MKDKDITQEIDEELRFHINMRIAENIASGMSPAEARADAFSRFGNIEGIRQTCISIDRGTHFRSAFWLLRILGVGGVALWASGITESFNVLGEMLAIIAALTSIFVYLRTQKRQTKVYDSDCVPPASNEQFVSPAVLEIRAPTRDLGLFLVALAFVLTIVVAGFALLSFSVRFLPIA